MGLAGRGPGDLLSALACPRRRNIMRARARPTRAAACTTQFTAGQADAAPVVNNDSGYRVDFSPVPGKGWSGAL